MPTSSSAPYAVTMLDVADAETRYASEADTLAARERREGEGRRAALWDLVAGGHREQAVRYRALADEYAP